MMPCDTLLSIQGRNKNSHRRHCLKPTHKIIALFSVVALLVVLVVGMAFWAFGQIESSAAARKHSYTILNSADDLLSALKDAETGQRGYLLTGDAAFIAPYLAVRDGLAGHLKQLRELTGISAGQKHLIAMEPLVDAKLAELAQSIELARTQNMPAAIALVASGQGKRSMDTIRAEMNSFVQFEEAARAGFDAQFQASLRLLFGVIVTASLLLLLIVASLVLLIYRETQNQLQNQLHIQTKHLLEMQETSNKQLQEVNATLQVSEEKLAVTLNSIGDGVIATDQAGNVTRMNPLAEQFTGWTESEASGHPIIEIFNIIHQQTREAAVVPVAETLATGTTHALANHTILIARDGSECAIADSCAPIRERDGKVVGAVLVFRDVTKEEVNRKILREVQARSDFALKMSHIGGWDLNLVDRTVHRTMEHARIYGYDSLAQPWNYKIFLEHVLPEDRANVARIIGDAITAQADYTLECRIRRADGEVRWLWSASEYQIGDGDQAPRLAGIVQDITEKKLIEAEQVRLNQAFNDKNAELENARFVADKANLAKSDFLSSMSHELRSPLNAILGFAQFLDSDTPPATPVQKESIDQILHAGWYLLELINEILDLSVVESGKLSLSSEPVSLGEVLNECQKMIEPQAQTRGLNLGFPKIDFSLFIRADRTRLKQVLLNLLSNAIKYNRAGGSVDVTCASVPKGRIRISIIDTGPGLSAGKLAQLFQPFNRLGQESSTEQGTGIGLVMSKRLVELMGGVISVESTVGVGSVFWFELDADEAPQIVLDSTPLSPVANPQRNQEAPTHTLLYVEDNPANLTLVQKLIARRPELRLLTAVDGLQGIQVARDNLPEVILMDINLPGISGIDAMKILRKDPLTAHIPVLAISANAMAGDIKRGMEAGFFGYLTKPIKVNEFMTALDGALVVARDHAVSRSNA
jgi:PAS domain S-box-containing protein